MTKFDAKRGNHEMPGTLLFSPLSMGGVELRNRMVVPRMHQYAAVKVVPTDWHLMNAGKFAAGGAGLVVVESTKVERRGCGTVGDLGIWDDKFIEPLNRLVKFIRQQLGRRNPARSFRPQGTRQASVGRRRAVAANAGDRRLGRVDAGGAERNRPQRERAGAEGAGAPRREGSRASPGPRGAPRP